MIDELLPPEAPHDEPLTRVRDRLVCWMLRHRLIDHDAIEALACLYDRRIADDAPSDEQWAAARRALDLDRDLALAFARDLALAHAFARDLARALDLVLALALARDLAFALDFVRERALARDLALALSRALARVLVALLGSRLTPINQLDATILDAVEVKHLFGLEMGSYHGEACGTTHCRAGSAIVLHPMGRELERVFGSWLAGAVIYQVSTGQVPDFFATNQEALADMRACAAQQTLRRMGDD